MTKTLVLLLFCLAAQAHAEQDVGLGPADWPETVRRAVPLIVARLTPQQREEIRKMKKDELIMLHHEWGTDIRNHLGLWRGNDRLREASCGLGCHPDDASMVLMKEAWEFLQSSTRR